VGTDQACGAPTVTRRQVAEENATGLVLDDSVGHAHGAILIDNQGALGGLPNGARHAVSAAQFGTVLAAARRNVSGGPTIIALAQQLRHAYGSVDLSADAPGARATVTPLETWHWPELATTRSLPFRYAGPMGRYRLQVEVNGVQREQREFSIRAGVADALAIRLRQVAAAVAPTTTATPQRRKGGVPVPLLVGGGLALAGGAVALLVLGGGGGDEPPTGSTGGITISIPNP
jgi:hypothetical protein